MRLDNALHFHQSARVKIVRSGRWLYDGAVSQPVDIVGLGYDFWYEIGRADDQLEPGERPQPLDADGLLYYLRFRQAGDTETPTWVDSPGYSTIEQAMSAAQEKAPSDITWSSA